MFLKDLEVEMKEWLNGVEVEVPDIISAAGYKVEVHEAVTEDGYILQLHRIPARAGGDGRPVYLQHGLLCSSACWVTSGRNSLAFILSDLGWDVWLGNLRGNAYGRRHCSLDPDQDDKFWRFTIHEHAYYDLPAGLKRCSRETGGAKISYIGHSMGTTSFLAMCSHNKPVADLLRQAVLLAPVVEPANMRSPLKYLAKVSTLAGAGFQSFGLQEFLPDWGLISKLITAPWLQSVYAIMLRYKFDPESTCVMKMISNTFRTGKTSIYTLMHYAQIVNQKTFAAYNWRVEDENIARYRITQPPKYMMTEVNVPCTIFWSEMDSIACYGDVQRLMAELQNLRSVEKVNLSHIDYLWGENAHTELYQKIVTTLSTEIIG